MKTLPFTILILMILVTACKDHENTGSSTAITFREFGPAQGTPVLYFHGFPGSYEDIHLFNGAALAEKLNLRIIAVNRPGYGDSGSQPGRLLSDWPGDVIKLVNELGIKEFSILGYSGGGPFVLACAHAIPERINQIVIVSGMGPVDAPKAKKGKAMMIPKAPKLILKGMSKMITDKPEKLEANMRKGFPEVDQEILMEPRAMEAMMKTITESFTSGYNGALEDAKIYKRVWEFELGEISQQVDIWHGGMDENVRMETALYVSEQLPDCQWKYFPDEGHVSLIYNHTEEILTTFLKE